jgi:hypothetical protein
MVKFGFPAESAAHSIKVSHIYRRALRKMVPQAKWKKFVTKELKNAEQRIADGKYKVKPRLSQISEENSMT